MQKDIGSIMGLYPTPVTVVGTVVDGHVNFLTIAHTGVVEHHAFIVSVDKAHARSERSIRDNKTLSVSLIDQKMMKAADWCGIAKVEKTDKSGAFAHRFIQGMPNAPIIEDAPVSMACEVIDMFEIGDFSNFVCNPLHTFVQEEYLTEKGKIDYEAASPVLFEFQSAQYLSTGKVIGQCWNIGRDFAPQA